MKNNPLVYLSVYTIKNVWHGKIGRNHNKKHHILCRFYPSCSNYAIMALEKYGFLKGWYMAVDRVMRCRDDNTDTCVDFP